MPNATIVVNYTHNETQSQHTFRFRAQITKDDVYVGFFNKMPCVHITKNDRKSGVLVSAGYFESCAVGGMAPKYGTIAMIQVALRVWLDTHPRHTHVVFSDESAIPCPSQARKEENISLLTHHLLTHGKTWYDRYFGAQLADSVAAGRYAESQRVVMGQLPDVSAFMTNVLSGDYTDRQEPGIREALQGATTIADGLRAINQRFRCNFFMNGTLDRIAVRLGVHNLGRFTWSIPKSAILAYDLSYDIVKDSVGDVSGGGCKAGKQIVWTAGDVPRIAKPSLNAVVDRLRAAGERLERRKNAPVY